MCSNITGLNLIAERENSKIKYSHNTMENKLISLNFIIRSEVRSKILINKLSEN